MIQVKKFSIEEWRLMGERGVLHEDERLEFRYGDIIKMTPIGKEHVEASIRLQNALVQALSGRAFVSSQNTLDLGGVEVYPDIAVLKMKSYKDALPMAKDVYWLIEVAKSSLLYDQGVKLADYALAGIPEYWIVNLVEERIEVYLEPYKNSYGVKRFYDFKEALAPQCFDIGQAWLKDY